MTHSQSAQEKANTQHYIGMNAIQHRLPSKFAPYLQKASDSDEDHVPEAEDIAEWDIKAGSAITSTEVDPAPSNAILISQKSHDESMQSAHPRERKQDMKRELHSRKEQQLAGVAFLAESPEMPI